MGKPEFDGPYPAAPPIGADEAWKRHLEEEAERIASAFDELHNGKPVDVAEVLAREFHATLERLAPEHDLEGARWRQLVPWERLSGESRDLLVAVQRELLDRGVIEAL